MTTPTIESERNQLVSFLLRHAGAANEELGQIFLTMIERVEAGHICMTLSDVDMDTMRALERCDVVTCDPARDVRPLVLIEDRLYVYRFYLYEERLMHHMRTRSRSRILAPEAIERAREEIQILFPEQSESEDLFRWGERALDLQKLAATVALMRQIVIVSGGPGTGKTTTVLRILALLSRALRGMAPLRMAMAAPTGKAADRLEQALRRERARLPDGFSQDELPDSVTTLHRLLRPIGTTRRYRFHSDNPLPLDLLVIDEASMVDLTLLAHTLDALPQSAGLILLGDHNQLASVEAGAVLGELCAQGMNFDEDSARLASFIYGANLPGLFVTRRNIRIAEHRSAMTSAVVELQHNYRFDSDSPIGSVSRAIRDGDSNQTRKLLEEHSMLVTPEEKDAAFEKLVVDGYEPLTSAIRRLEAQTHPGDAMWERAALDALDSLDRFRILCALRHGPEGVRRANARAAEALILRGRLDPSLDHDGMKQGYPILITRNDYQANLMNGDTGIVVLLNRERYGLFRGTTGDGDLALRLIPAPLLPPHEVSFAITIHKSQGSEFDEVAIMLPAVDSPLLTRELFYTAITRARTKAIVFSDVETIARTVSRRIHRESGLAALHEMITDSQAAS